MKRARELFIAACVLWTASSACGRTDAPDNSADFVLLDGGNFSGNGGEGGFGAEPNGGGGFAGGGFPSTGGFAGTGGVSTGGFAGTGGFSTGGFSGSGGVPGTGGVAGTGGFPIDGGSGGSGGVPSTGGIGGGGGSGGLVGRGPCCKPHDGGGCGRDRVSTCVCLQDSYCCAVRWDETCAAEVESFACGRCPDHLTPPSPR